MKIILVRHDDDVVGSVVANDDAVEQIVANFRAANSMGMFEIDTYPVEQVNDVLGFVETENISLRKELRGA